MMTKAMKAAMNVQIEAIDEQVKAAAGVLCDEDLADQLKKLRSTHNLDDIELLRDEVEAAVCLASEALSEAERHLAEVENLLTPTA
jgi:hypothetical protein